MPRLQVNANETELHPQSLMLEVKERGRAFTPVPFIYKIRAVCSRTAQVLETPFSLKESFVERYRQCIDCNQFKGTLCGIISKQKQQKRP